MGCPHNAFTADTQVRRMKDAKTQQIALYAETKIRCRQCGTPFDFVGVGPSVNIEIAPRVLRPLTDAAVGVLAKH